MNYPVKQFMEDGLLGKGTLEDPKMIISVDEYEKLRKGFEDLAKGQKSLEKQREALTEEARKLDDAIKGNAFITTHRYSSMYLHEYKDRTNYSLSDTAKEALEPFVKKIKEEYESKAYSERNSIEMKTGTEVRARIARMSVRKFKEWREYHR